MQLEAAKQQKLPAILHPLQYASTKVIPTNLHQTPCTTTLTCRYKTHLTSILSLVDVHPKPTPNSNQLLKSGASLDTRSPIMSPKSPSTELNISITRTLTNLSQALAPRLNFLDLRATTYRLGSAASANAALLPLIPTETPQIRLHMPTSKPPQKSA